MTVMNRKHERIVFPRSTLHEFWLTLRDHYAHEDPRNWKYLAMLALQENSGWSQEQIGLAFGHPKGHVSRCLHAVKRRLRAQFQVPAGVLSRDDEGFSDPDRPTPREVERAPSTLR